jgi:hypothetical protein
MVGQALAASLSVPLLIGLRGDFSLYKEFSEFPTLRLALEGHLRGLP